MPGTGNTDHPLAGWRAGAIQLSPDELTQLSAAHQDKVGRARTRTSF
jgi:hypothetical protein